MLNLIIAVVIVAVLVVLALASTKPAVFEIRRTARMAAPPERIFPLIADFRNWTQWSPYEKLDPDLKRSYSGAQSGVGAAYAWEGAKAGSGDMTITEATPPSRIVLDLRFTKPMKAHNTTEFLMEPEDGATLVTWRMTGRNGLMARVMGVFINIDRMAGKAFEVGLANLRGVVER